MNTMITQLSEQSVIWLAILHENHDQLLKRTPFRIQVAFLSTMITWFSEHSVIPLAILNENHD